MERDRKGRFAKEKTSLRQRKPVPIDHDYCHDLPADLSSTASSSTDDSSWKVGRRLVEWEVLLSNLEFCKVCKLGPVALTLQSLKGELQKGLGGYLYVECGNPECGHLNRAAYGKTHRESTSGKGMPCFVVNTKLGTAMVDSLGGPSRVNNFLSTLNLKTVSDPNLRRMERRAGNVVEIISKESASQAAKEAFRNEMEAIANQESLDAQANMSDIISDLGVGPLPDSSPALKMMLKDIPDTKEWFDSTCEDPTVGENYQSNDDKELNSRSGRRRTTHMQQTTFDDIVSEGENVR